MISRRRAWVHTRVPESLVQRASTVTCDPMHACTPTYIALPHGQVQGGCESALRTTDTVSIEALLFSCICSMAEPPRVNLRRLLAAGLCAVHCPAAQAGSPSPQEQACIHAAVNVLSHLCP